MSNLPDVTDLDDNAQDIVNNYDHMLRPVTADTILITNKYQDEFEEIFEEKKEEKREQYEQEEEEHQTRSLWRSYRADARQEAKRELVKRHQDEPCPLELRELKQFAQMFRDYDLSKPDVQLPVRSLLSMVLSSVRMQIDSIDSGVTELVERGGGMETRVNPVLKEKRKYDKDIIKGIKDLKEMLEGKKVEVEHSFSLKDYMQSLQDNDEDVIDVTASQSE